MKNGILTVCYEVDKKYDSDRFIKLKLNVMHDGKNFNMSSFNKKSIEKAKPSIFNVPILAHTLFDDDGNPKFGGHDKHIEEDKDGNKKIIYDEIPIGLVPESTNYEVKLMDDKKYHLFVDAYVWKGYSNYAEDILNNKESVGLSMEIIVDKYTFDTKKSIFNITDYRYQGITLLGDDKTPAMQGANATFDINLSYSEIIDKMKILLENELATYDSKEEGGKRLDKEENIQVFDETHGKDDDKTEEKEKDFEHSLEYETVKEKIELLSKKVSDLGFRNDDQWVDYYLRDFDNKYVYIDKHIDQKINGKWKYTNLIVRRSYSVVDSDYQIGEEEVEMVNKLLTKDEAAELEEKRTQLEAQIYELQQYKDSKLKEERDNKLQEIFNKFDEKLNGNDTYESLKGDSDLSPEDIEDKCYSLIGRLNYDKLIGTDKKEDKNTDNESIVLGFDTQNKPTSDYEYADLLESEYKN